ncbi:hypothetical protein C8Q76DRAFT_789312 [Earliella scabrosa]|nr:hypothetical protein C8Q76DRAFT_789312 [Earliella scabrosa]
MTICNGCGKDFKRLSTHERICKSTRSILGGIKSRVAANAEAQRKVLLRQRRLEEVRRQEAAVRVQAEAAEQARREAERLASQPIVVETHSRTGRQHRAPARIHDMIPTSLRGLLPHIPRPPKPPPPPPPPPRAKAPPATVEDAPDEDIPNPQPPVAMRPPAHVTPPNRFGVFREYAHKPQRDPEVGIPLHDFADSPAHQRPPPNAHERNGFCPLGVTLAQCAGQAARSARDVAANSIAPFLNWSTFKLMEWQYSGSTTKSMGELQRLVDNVLSHSEFNPADLQGFSAQREQRRLDEHNTSGGPLRESDGWRELSVDLHLPAEGREHPSEAKAPAFTVSGIWSRNFTTLLVEAYEDLVAHKYHWSPFKLFRRRSSPTNPQVPPERLYTDIYNSDAMLKEHEDLQALPRDETDPPDMEYAVAPILVYSDSTHLTNFGTAYLWPIYIFIGNLTKYLRCKPSMYAAHHLAYIPAIPTALHEAYVKAHGFPMTDKVRRVLKKDLMQQIWLALLDPEFMHAYTHGIVVKCGDGVMRRLFPRILLYSADYVEKCLIACLQQSAKCLCPDCLIEKKNVFKMGTIPDMKSRERNVRKDDSNLWSWITRIRSWIFNDGTAPEGAAVKKTPLHGVSAVPTRCAFSIRFAQFGCNAYSLFVPDLMHEFEIGVWKSTFQHLIRILVAAGGNLVQVLDKRYAMVPTFGRRLIRRFGLNTSGMKKLAARDYEQMLQCSIPVFENLLPAAANEIVMTMLFNLCTWHAFAKLRLHSETTLNAFDLATRALGQSMRAFLRKVCPTYATRELPKETQCRLARAARAATKDAAPKPAAASSKIFSAPLKGPDTPAASSRPPQGPVSSASSIAALPPTGLTKSMTREAPKRAPAKAIPQKRKSRRKVFDLNTYKYHRLGDYVRTIRLFGTTDNFTTQTGELEHRRVKRLYALTNKNSRFAKQIALHTRRQVIMHKLTRGQAIRRRPSGQIPSSHPGPTVARSLQLPAGQAEGLLPSAPAEHYQISEDQRHHTDLRDFLYDNRHDPACRNFAHDLKAHIWRRLPGVESTPDDYQLTREDVSSVRIVSNKLYRHHVLRINYTTYDMRRAQDSINPRTRPDIMMFAPSTHSHPYLYARVLGVFHVNAYRAGADLTGADDGDVYSIPVLWVRWLDLDASAPGGFRRCHVLRAVHLIPAFAHGPCDKPSATLATPADDPMDVDTDADDANEEDAEEWKYHYVNMFVDRDMFMRFCTGALTKRAELHEWREEEWQQWKHNLSGRANGTIDSSYGCFLRDELIDYAVNLTFPWANGDFDVYDIPDSRGPELLKDMSALFNDHRMHAALHTPTFKDWLRDSNYPFGSYGDPSLALLSELAANAVVCGVKLAWSHRWTPISLFWASLVGFNTMAVCDVYQYKITKADAWAAYYEGYEHEIIQHDYTSDITIASIDDDDISHLISDFSTLTISDISYESFDDSIDNEFELSDLDIIIPTVSISSIASDDVRLESTGLRQLMLDDAAH